MHGVSVSVLRSLLRNQTNFSSNRLWFDISKPSSISSKAYLTDAAFRAFSPAQLTANRKPHGCMVWIDHAFGRRFDSSIWQTQDTERGQTIDILLIDPLAFLVVRAPAKPFNTSQLIQSLEAACYGSGIASTCKSRCSYNPCLPDVNLLESLDLLSDGTHLNTTLF